MGGTFGGIFPYHVPVARKTTEGMGMGQAPRWYRVEHRHRGRERFLGRISEVVPSPFTLDPFLSRLLRAGVEHGELALVDGATGFVVARRLVRMPRRRRPEAA
jgi:hypothetical protein